MDDGLPGCANVATSSKRLWKLVLPGRRPAGWSFRDGTLLADEALLRTRSKPAAFFSRRKAGTYPSNCRQRQDISVPTSTLSRQGGQNGEVDLLARRLSFSRTHRRRVNNTTASLHQMNAYLLRGDLDLNATHSLVAHCMQRTVNVRVDTDDASGFHE